MKVDAKDGVRRSTRRVVRAFSQHKARFVRMAEIHTDGEAIYSYGVTIAVRRGRRIYATDGVAFGSRIRRRCSEVLQLLPKAKLERDLLGAAKAAARPAPKMPEVVWGIAENGDEVLAKGGPVTGVTVNVAGTVAEMAVSA